MESVYYLFARSTQNFMMSITVMVCSTALKDHGVKVIKPVASEIMNFLPNID